MSDAPRLTCTFLSFATALASQVNTELPLVPAARECRMDRGTFTLTNDVTITASAALRRHASVLAEELEILTGVRVRLGDSGDASTPRIELRLEGARRTDSLGLADERYELLVSQRQIVATAASPTGLCWATSTLLQSVRLEGTRPHVPCMKLRDHPRNPYRALMIDVARQPHSIDVLRGVVRIARLFRVRFVQLHLTDDQHFTYPFAPVTDHLKNNKSFRREELRGLLDYAAARGITLIPEIDLPGHSRRLRQSGYLGDAKTDRDVASERHWPALSRMLGDVIDLFEASPFFHVGGDESGAGRQLVPFLARVNRLVRTSGKRLIVWEGFHGAPTKQLPAAGQDRILVASWESSYNAPWNLLQHGYELINASWAPLYVVGGDTRIHPGSSSGRKWSPETIGRWHKDRFMHWEPGRPVFEDRGPNDENRDDGVWDVPNADWRNRVLGGQISVWEQRESSLLRSLRHRVPIFAERSWNGPSRDTADVSRDAKVIDERLWGIVQPVEIRLGDATPGPMNRIAKMYAGEETIASLHNRTKIPGRLLWSMQPFRGSWNWIDFRDPITPSRSNKTNRIPIKGGAAVRAMLITASGRRIGAETWQRFLNWPMRVRVTDYDIGRRIPKRGSGLDGGVIPSFESLRNATVIRRYALPMLRGPIDHKRVRFQRLEANLVAPETGEFELGMKTQSGHATLWFDGNRDGQLVDAERIIPETPNTEARITTSVALERGKTYRIRIDHVAALPRPVLIVTLDRPGTKRPREISAYLQVLPQPR